MVAERLVTLNQCTVLAITRNAVLIEYQGKKLWVPKTEIHEPESFWILNTEVTMRVSKEFSKKEGLK